MNILLSTTYLPPISYFQKLVSDDTIVIEKHEHFIKQTYRNRCCIYGANGALDLSIPLQKQSDKEIICDKKISYAENWQILHWRSIVSAYKGSPYFEYFEADFKPFYEKHFEYLFDYNMELLALLFKLLRIDPKISFTEEYSVHPENCIDLRNTIQPKTESDFAGQPYYQVFADKHGFIPNLSIIDLFFNEGLETLTLLK